MSNGDPVFASTRRYREIFSFEKMVARTCGLIRFRGVNLESFVKNTQPSQDHMKSFGKSEKPD